MIIIDSHRFGPPPPYVPPSTVLRDVILADSPFAYFELNEPSGTTMVNSAPGGANGTYVNSPTLQGQNGVTESSYHTVFNGSNQYGYFAPSLGSPTALTLECWTVPNGLPSGTGVMSNAYSGSNVALEIGAGLPSGGNIKHAGTYNGNWTSSGSGAYSTGTVYHIVGVHTGSSLLLYINGALIDTVGVGAVPAPNATWYVGRRHDVYDQTYWNGVIAHASLYTYALSAGQILAHYNASII